MDEVSTEAGDSSAFASIFSRPSSVAEGFDSKSEDSASTGDIERSIMVCKHWKSKGWCRLESRCKFLHPEDKCGVSAPRACSMAGGEINGSSSLLDMTGTGG